MQAIHGTLVPGLLIKEDIMKKTALFASGTLLALVLTACAGGGSGSTHAAGSAQQAAENSISKNHKVLVAYFSYGENAGLGGTVDANASASVQPAEIYMPSGWRNRTRPVIMKL